MQTNTLFATVANRLFLAGLFLLPTMLALSLTVPLVPMKMVIATVMLVGALIVTVLGAFKRGAISIPVTPLLWSVWLIPLTALVSALLGPSFLWSVIGGALDIDTVFFVSLIALAVSLPYAFFDKKSDYMRAFVVLLAAGAVVAVFHLARLFLGADTFSFGLMTNALFSPVGKWNDLGIFFGLIGLMSLITLESLTLKTAHQWVVGVALVVSLFFVALVNFVPVWVVLAVLSLGIVLNKFLLASREGMSFSLAGTVVFVISVLAIVFTTSVGGQLGQAFGIQQIEARPSWESTLAVGQSMIMAHSLTGGGPNTFVLGWDKYRPTEINQSIFWNADFTSGVGMIPTAFATTGVVGTIAWLIFLVLFVVAGVRGLLLKAPQDMSSYHVMMATYAGALYMLIMSIVYLPSAQLALVGFAILGMFVAIYHKEVGGRTFDVDFRERPRIGFVVVLVLALTLVASVMTFYGVGTAFAAATYYEKAAEAAQVQGNVDVASASLDRAIQLFPQDQYYRLGVLVHLAKLNAIVNSAPTQGGQTEAQQKFQQELGAAVENGLSAVRLNQTNYRNWASLGTAYQSVVALNVEGSYDAAVNAFTQARIYNPSMPTLPLSLAQLEIIKGKNDAARALVEEAVTLKQDYTPALTLLAQLELQRGDLPAAIKRAESAAVFEPSNPVMFFQVGVLKFENKDYKGAQSAFERAVAMASDYANARYYLGRTLIKLGDSAGAQAQFEEVLKSNQDNAEVQSILAALKAGKDPFAPTKK